MLDFKSFRDSELINKAAQYAQEAHKGQFYGDRDYYEYHICGVIRRTYSMGGNELACAVAALHDVFEDCDITAPIFVRDFDSTFSQTICNFMRVLTRQEDEPYTEYIQRCKMGSYFGVSGNVNDGITKLVKLADLSFNLEQNLIGMFPSIKRANKYREAIEVLNA